VSDIQDRVAALERTVVDLRIQAEIASAEAISAAEDALNLEHHDEFMVPQASDVSKPFNEQFYVETDVRDGSGNPQVRVWEGDVRSHFGIERWPTAVGTDSELFSITTNGWLVVRREIANAAGDPDVVFRVTEADPEDFDFHEENLARIVLSGGDIYLFELNPGQKTFRAKATCRVGSTTSVSHSTTTSGDLVGNFTATPIETNDLILEGGADGITVKDGYSGIYKLDMNIDGEVNIQDPQGSSSILVKTTIDGAAGEEPKWYLILEGGSGMGVTFPTYTPPITVDTPGSLSMDLSVAKEDSASAAIFVDASGGDVLVSADWTIGIGGSPVGQGAFCVRSFTLTLLELRDSAT